MSQNLRSLAAKSPKPRWKPKKAHRFCCVCFFIMEAFSNIFGMGNNYPLDLPSRPHTTYPGPHNESRPWLSSPMGGIGPMFEEATMLTLGWGVKYQIN